MLIFIFSDTNSSAIRKKNCKIPKLNSNRFLFDPYVNSKDFLKITGSRLTRLFSLVKVDENILLRLILIYFVTYFQDSFFEKLVDFAHLSESVNERTSKDRVIV